MKSSRILILVILSMFGGVFAAALSAANQAIDTPSILIDAVYYDGQLNSEPDEAIRLVNWSEGPVDLSQWSLNDSLTDSTRLVFPSNFMLPAGERIWIAKDAAAFRTSFGYSPTVSAADLSGSWIGLANSGDEVVLRDAQDQLIDLVTYENSTAGMATSAWLGEPLQPYKIHNGTAVEGQILYRKTDPLSGLPFMDSNSAADWAQDPQDPIWGRKVLYPGWNLEMYRLPTSMTTSAAITLAIAPDHGFEFLAAQIDQAQQKIVIEAHTFDNAALADRLAQAAERGVDVKLLLEGGPPGGVSDQAKANCEHLATAGGQCWVMRSDPDADVSDRYDYIHSKFMIFDQKTVVISSENLSPNSLPPDPKNDGTWGRRGTLIAVTAPEIANYFSTLWEIDFAPEQFGDIQPIDVLGGPPPGFVPLPASNPVTYTVRHPTPLNFNGTFEFEIIQAPENALVPDRGIFGRIRAAGAGDVILTQQLVERQVWRENDPYGGNPRLIELIEAARRGAEVWMMLDEYFDDSSESLSNHGTCLYVNQLALEEKLNLHCQLQNPAGLGIHNKMMLFQIGGVGFSHIGSFNGTEQSFKGNREVGITIQSNDLYAALAKVFWGDWRFVNYLPLAYHSYIGPADHLLISEVYPDPYGALDAAEFIELVNPTGHPIDLSGYSVSDALVPEEFADLRRFPVGVILPPGGVVVIAQQATAFFDTFKFDPHFEILNSSEQVPDLLDDPGWGDPNQFLRLGNQGDVVLLRDSEDQVIDVVGYGSRVFEERLSCELVPPGHSLRRRPFWRDTAHCPNDFEIWPAPDPGKLPTDQ